MPTGKGDLPSSKRLTASSRNSRTIFDLPIFIPALTAPPAIGTADARAMPEPIAVSSMLSDSRPRSAWRTPSSTSIGNVMPSISARPTPKSFMAVSLPRISSAKFLAVPSSIPLSTRYVVISNRASSRIVGSYDVRLAGLFSGSRPIAFMLSISFLLRGGAASGCGSPRSLAGGAA